MRYYAHFGHKEFVLCLGYRGDLIREYFLNYNECMTNDFMLSEGGKQIELHSTRHRRLAHHVRRHRPAHQHRQRLLRGAQVPRGRGDRSSRTTPTGCPTCRLERRDRGFPASATSSPVSSAVRSRAELPRRARRRRRHRRRSIGRDERASMLDQRRLLRAAPGDLRLHRAKATSWSSSRSAPHRASAAARRTATTASGRRWTRSRTRSSSTAWKRGRVSVDGLAAA